ncbi:MAG: anthranilate synthase component [Myxococcales bacterium]|nr:anthranilate synthase component [Myxococcales bacterium]
MSHSPSLAEFRAAASNGNLVPVWREIVLDGDTPVSAYAKLGRRPYSFLLESVVGGEKWAAYSFIGVGARAVLTARGGRYEVVRYDVEGGGAPSRYEGPLPDADPTRVLASLIGSFRPVPSPSLPRFFGGAVGWLGYDVVRAFERIASRAPDELGIPEACFVITDTLVIFDNLRQTVKVVANAVVDSPADAERAWSAACARVDAVVTTLEGPSPRLRPLDPLAARVDDAPLKSNTTREAYKAAVVQAKEFILAGDVFQVVVSQRFEAPRAAADPFDVYRALRVVNPSPYMFQLDYGEIQVTGASPEVLVRVDGEPGAAKTVTVRPIAGTRPRGKTPDEDQRLEAELRADPKERAEHVMLIDLGRNDVGRVSRIGSVRVDENMIVERYSHVMHLTSSVSGEVADGRGALDVLRACFPAGTLTGAPKIRAMQIIEELEPARRGVYGGAVGYVSFTGNLDMSIAIRTLVTKGDTVYLQAGAGIVADSDPDAEYEETLAKARAVVRALAMARPTRDNI